VRAADAPADQDADDGDQYSWPISISITARTWPSEWAAVKSRNPVVARTVKL
jgi:hypothetical protein